jgi:hypothetical protein
MLSATHRCYTTNIKNPVCCRSLDDPVVNLAQASLWPRRGRLTFANPCDDIISHCQWHIMLQHGSSRSVRSKEMDPYPWSLSLWTNWRSGGLRLRGHFSFVSVSKIEAWRGKHDESSRTSVVFDLCVHLGRDPKLLMPTTPFSSVCQRNSLMTKRFATISCP